MHKGSRNSGSRHTALLAERSRGLRFALTPAEAVLWAAIRGGRLGVVFRRQVPVGRFIVDFLAPAASLALEVDGTSHQRRREKDARRDAFLRRQGLRVLRLENALVLGNLPEALRQVREALVRAGV